MYKLQLSAGPGHAYGFFIAAKITKKEKIENHTLLRSFGCLPMLDDPGDLLTYGEKTVAYHLLRLKYEAEGTIGEKVP